MWPITQWLNLMHCSEAEVNLNTQSTCGRRLSASAQPHLSPSWLTVMADTLLITWLVLIIHIVVTCTFTNDTRDLHSSWTSEQICTETMLIDIKTLRNIECIRYHLFTMQIIILIQFLHFFIINYLSSNLIKAKTMSADCNVALLRSGCALDEQILRRLQKTREGYCPNWLHENDMVENLWAVPARGTYKLPSTSTFNSCTMKDIQRGPKRAALTHVMDAIELPCLGQPVPVDLQCITIVWKKIRCNYESEAGNIIFDEGGIYFIMALWRKFIGK